MVPGTIMSLLWQRRLTMPYAPKVGISILSREKYLWGRWYATPKWHWRYWIGHKWRMWTGYTECDWEYETDVQRAHAALREACCEGVFIPSPPWTGPIRPDLPKQDPHIAGQVWLNVDQLTISNG